MIVSLSLKTPPKKNMFKGLRDFFKIEKEERKGGQVDQGRGGAVIFVADSESLTSHSPSAVNNTEPRWD